MARLAHPRRWLGGLVVTGTLLAGCSSQSLPSSSSAPTSEPPPAVQATTTTVPPASTSTTTTTAAAGPVGPCTIAELTISAGQTGAGLGHVGGPVLFTNAGSTECSLFGYPGVAALDPAGQQVAQATRTPSGYLGGLWTGATSPPTVDLAPGQTAAALVEGTDNPVGTPPPASCPQYAGLLVTPPTALRSVRLTMRLPGCSGLEVHPVVPGTTGRST